MSQAGHPVVVTYADVIRWYGIKLDPLTETWVRVFFLGAAHHLRHAERRRENPAYFRFHFDRYEAHLRHLIEFVYYGGDFSGAFDRSGMGMDQKESWNPEELVIPDPEMFDEARDPDINYGPGVPHAYDVFLRYTKDTILKREEGQVSFHGAA